MISANELARQTHLNNLKHDATELAFTKAKQNIEASGSFKFMFDHADVSDKPSAIRNNTLPDTIKRTLIKRADRHVDHHKDDADAPKHVDKKHIDKHDVKEASGNDQPERTAKETAPEKPEKVDAKKDTQTETDAAEKKDACCDDTVTADTTNNTQTSAAPAVASDAETAVASDAETAVASDAETAVASDAEINGTVPAGALAEALNDQQNVHILADETAHTPLIALPLGIQAQPETQRDVTATDSNTSDDPRIAINPLITAKVNANAQSPVLTPNTESTRKANSKLVDAAHGKVTHNGSDDIHSDALSAKLHDAVQTRDDVINDTVDKKDILKDAKNKHADILELLQGKRSANETLPAASDRAIPLAVNAKDSPAPTPNGLAGGGSPIAGKLDSLTTGTPHTTGLEGMPHAKGDALTFVNTLRAVKEGPATTMLPSEQVAVHMHRMAKTGATQYDLQLHPAELGRVDIRLEINKDGMVQATVTADNQQAFDMLQRDSRSLERALNQAGLQTDSGSLSFSLRQGDNGAAGHQNAQNNAHGQHPKWAEKNMPDEAVQAKIVNFNVNGTLGRIDVMI